MRYSFRHLDLQCCWLRPERGRSAGGATPLGGGGGVLRGARGGKGEDEEDEEEPRLRHFSCYDEINGRGGRVRGNLDFRETRLEKSYLCRAFSEKRIVLEADFSTRVQNCSRVMSLLHLHAKCPCRNYKCMLFYIREK